MAGAQDGTFSCVGYIEVTERSQNSTGRRLVTNVYCVCVGYRSGGATGWVASDMTEGPHDGAASEEDRRRKQPPRLRLSRHAEPGGGQVESVGDLHSQRQAGVSSAVLG